MFYYDFSKYRKRTFEYISENEIIQCIESEDTITWNSIDRPHTDFAYECLNYVNKRFIFVRFNCFGEKIVIEMARLATKGEIEKYFKF